MDGAAEGGAAVAPASTPTRVARAQRWTKVRLRPWLVRTGLWPGHDATTLPVPAVAVVGAACGVAGALVGLAYEALLHALVHLTWEIVFDAYRAVRAPPSPPHTRTHSHCG
jgi:hypothetical protein